jgi:hypothetical protein
MSVPAQESISRYGLRKYSYTAGCARELVPRHERPACADQSPLGGSSDTTAPYSAAKAACAKRFLSEERLIHVPASP